VSFDGLYHDVLELFSEHGAAIDRYAYAVLNRREMQWVLMEPAPFTFTPEGFAGEAKRLEAEAAERDARWLAVIGLRLERERHRWRMRHYQRTPAQAARINAGQRERYAAKSAEAHRERARRKAAKYEATHGVKWVTQYMRTPKGKAIQAAWYQRNKAAINAKRNERRRRQREAKHGQQPAQPEASQ
jgi:hypothetical protein